MPDPYVAAINQIGDEFKNSTRPEIQTLYELFKGWANQAADSAETVAELIGRVTPGDKVAEDAIAMGGLVASHQSIETFGAMNAIRLADITARLERIENSLELVKAAVDPTLP